ncbi:MAG: acyl-CoA dehydrogenase family protein [Chloroflexi bacterium]|nr:acyl-CoA dehydrogenase family protein [Chloroflexota bacterium]
MEFEPTEEQRMLKQTVREVAEREFRPRAAEWDEREEVAWPNIRRLGELGMLGVTLPPEYGGSGRTVLDAVLVVEEVARVCANTAAGVVVTSLGPPSMIVHYGTEQQKGKYLPRCARGEIVMGFAFTEPGAGSDATNLSTTAIRDGDDYVINGVKHFTSYGGVAEVYMVYARFGPSKGSYGLGALLVDKGTPGLSFGKREKFIGLRGVPHYEEIFQNCRVPATNVVIQGDPAATEGFSKLMTAANMERCGNPAISLGLAQGAFEAALKFAREREQFGQPIGQFQGIQWMLADMVIKVEAGRFLLYRAASKTSHGQPSVIETSIAKTYLNEAALEVINTAIQIHGGYGYSSEFPIERMWRDARGLCFGAGTTQIHRNVIGGQLLRGVLPN